MRDALKKIKRQKNLMVGGSITLLVAAMAVFAPWLAPYDPIEHADLMHSEEPPNRHYLFGTDNQGRDILSRVIYGSRISLTVGLVSQGLNSLIGIILGVTAGFIGRRWDDFVMGLTNILLSIPSLVFALAIMAVLGPGLVNIFLALGFTNWAYSCRITRSQVLSARSLDYVVAARALGYGRGADHVHPDSAQCPGPDSRGRHPGCGRRDSPRSLSFVPRFGGPTPDPELGRNAFHGEGTALHGPLDLHLPGGRHLRHGAGFESPGGRPEGHPRPPYGSAKKRIKGKVCRRGHRRRSRNCNPNQTLATEGTEFTEGKNRSKEKQIAWKFFIMIRKTAFCICL
jgi:ABC-type amino acid transport system permease subunit